LEELRRRKKEMRLHLLLSKVDPKAMAVPTKCGYADCNSLQVRLHQPVSKALRDTVHSQVEVHRYRCLKCRRTFRIYPVGVSHAQSSERVRGLAVMLYLLGLSYGAVSLALESLGVPLSKTRVYEVVQEVASRVPGLKREQVFQSVKTKAVGADLTSVKCAGRWLHLGLSVDALTGLVLTIDELTAEDTQTLQAWIEPIAHQVGAQILVSDDADGFKAVADETGLLHQVCKSHVKRNTEALIDEFRPLAASDHDGSLKAIGVTPQEARADLDRLGELICSRQPEQGAQLEQMHRRYLPASAPQKGATASLAYRLRLLFLDRWNLWTRLTRYRKWQGPHQERLDGTNNACERAIGWWIKERYRSMRGYKVPINALRVSRLLAWCGNFLNTGGADLATLFQ
jgi:transposase IS66 family protein